MSSFHASLSLTALAALSCLSVHCASDDSGDDVDADVTALKICPKQTVEGGVVRCTQTHPTAPFLRPSLADTLDTSKAKFYGGILPPNTIEQEFRLFDRNGKVYLATDSRGRPLEFTRPPTTLKNLKLPNNQVYFTLYRFEGTLKGSATAGGQTAPAFVLNKVTPIATLDGCAIDSLLLGTWEGTTTTRLDPAPTGNPMFTPYFDEGNTVPLKVTFKTLAKYVDLADWTGEVIADQQTYMASGTIDNYADFALLKKRNPFLGSTNGKVNLYRKGSMHGVPNDNHWVLDYPGGTVATTGNGMSYEMQALSVASLLAPANLNATQTKTLREISVKPHLPYNNNGFVVTLRPTRIGASAGNCPR